MIKHHNNISTTRSYQHVKYTASHKNKSGYTYAPLYGREGTMRDGEAWANWCNIVQYFGSKIDQDWSFHFEHVLQAPQPISSTSNSDASPVLAPTSKAAMPLVPEPPPYPPKIADDPESDDLPEWFTFSKDIKVWHSTLVNHEVDENAMQKLIRLATLNDAGWQAANDIIDQLVHKAAHGQLSNPSGFVMSNAYHARNEIVHGPKGESKFSTGDSKGSTGDSKGSKGSSERFEGRVGIFQE